MFINMPKNWVHMGVYKRYKNEAQELNRIQMRLSRVIAAIKARCAYDGWLGEEIAEELKPVYYETEQEEEKVSYKPLCG